MATIIFARYLINKDLNFTKGNNDGDFFYAKSKPDVFKIHMHECSAKLKAFTYTYYICGIPKGLVTILNPHATRIIHYRHLIAFLSIPRRSIRYFRFDPKILRKNRPNCPLLTQVFLLQILPYVTDYAELTKLPLLRGHSRIRSAFAIS